MFTMSRGNLAFESRKLNRNCPPRSAPSNQHEGTTNRERDGSGLAPATGEGMQGPPQKCITAALPWTNISSHTPTCPEQPLSAPPSQGGGGAQRSTTLTGEAQWAAGRQHHFNPLMSARSASPQVVRYACFCAIASLCSPREIFLCLVEWEKPRLTRFPLPERARPTREIDVGARVAGYESMT